MASFLTINKSITSPLKGQKEVRNEREKKYDLLVYSTIRYSY